MDYNTAKRLLERYFAGTSTREEEAQLRNYFQQERLPTDMEPYRPLFQFFVAAAKQKTRADFAQHPSRDQLRSSTGTLIQLAARQWHLFAVAAMVVLALAMWMFAPVTPQQNQQTAIDWSQYEPKNEEEALRLTTSALRKTSTSLRLGLDAATKELKAVKKIVQPF
jgi:hypothetical protein